MEEVEKAFEAYLDAVEAEVRRELRKDPRTQDICQDNIGIGVEIAMRIMQSTGPRKRSQED